MITSANYEGFLLDYIEGTLSPALQKEMEAFLIQNLTLPATNDFIFPDKERLKKKTGYTLPLWVRYAAAALFIGLISYSVSHHFYTTKPTEQVILVKSDTIKQCIQNNVKKETDETNSPVLPHSSKPSFPTKVYKGDYASQNTMVKKTKDEANQTQQPFSVEKIAQQQATSNNNSDMVNNQRAMKKDTPLIALMPSVTNNPTSIEKVNHVVFNSLEISPTLNGTPSRSWRERLRNALLPEAIAQDLNDDNKLTLPRIRLVSE